MYLKGFLFKTLILCRIASQTEEAHESWVNDGSASGDVDGGGLSIFIQLIGLSKIIESVLTLVFSTKMIKSPRKELVMKRITSVEELNVRLFHWHSALPEDLTWNQWTPSTQSLSPPAAILQ